MKDTFAHKHGTPPARVAVVRVWYSLNGDGRCPLISQWIAQPSERPEHQDVANVADASPPELVVTRG